MCVKKNKIRAGKGSVCFYGDYILLFIPLFQLLDFEFQGNYIAKQQQLHIKTKFSSKKTFSFLNKARVRSWDVHLVLYSSLHWKLSLSFFFRHLSPEDRVLNLIIIGETVKIECSLQKYALLESSPRVRKEMLFLDFHGWIISKSLVFKKKRLGFSSYFRASGIAFTFALQRHFSGQAEKKGVIDINLAFQQILEDFSLLLPLRAMPSFLCWLWATGVRHLKAEIEIIR